MRALKYLIIFLAGFIVLNAKVKFEFDGYVFDMPSYQKFPPAFKNDFFKELIAPDLVQDDFYMNLTRIRARPSVEFGKNSRITMQYEFDALISKVYLPYLGSTDKTNRQLFDLNWNISDDKVYQDVKLIANHYIDMLYYKHFFDFGEFVLGRQVISWGVGRVWQPTDMFNPINPANFAKLERDGADALSSKIYLGAFTDLELVVNFRDKFGDYNYGGRFRTNYGEYDLALTAGYFDKNAVVGGSFQGNLFEAGLRGEGIFSYNDRAPGSNYARIILGMDYQFNPELYALAEYQYNGRGTTDKDEYIYYFEKLSRGEIQNIGKNYLALMSNYQFHPLVTGTLTSISNLNDESGLVGFEGSYNVLQNLNAGLGAMFFYGDKGSEYSYYSTALYLTGQYYF